MEKLSFKCDIQIIFSSLTEEYEFDVATVSTESVNQTDIQVNVFLSEDDITLEYDDQFALLYIPELPLTIADVEPEGEFIRHNVTINIMDNDSKQIELNWYVVVITYMIM